MIALLRKLFWVAFIIIAFVFAMLAADQEKVAVRFLNWQTSSESLFWWLFAAFVVGLLLGSIGATLLSMKHRLSNRKLDKQLGERDRELRELRSLTLKD